MRRRFKNWFIFHATRIAIALAGLVPARSVVTAGRWLGTAAYLVAPRERRLAQRHLAMAFRRPASGQRVRLLARGVFAHLGQNAIEICRILNSPNKAPQVIIPKKSEHTLQTALDAGKGVVFVTGHLGNWEVMAQALSGLGFPISTVAKPSYDPRFTRLIDRFRSRGGVESVYRDAPGSAARMLRTLRTGRVLGFLIDQDTSVKSAFVPFFGRPAYTPVGAAAFALRSGAPVVVGSIHRAVDGAHLLTIEPCELPADVTEATARLTAHLESRIRRHPSQWVWFHRRWKTRPADEATA